MKLCTYLTSFVAASALSAACLASDMNIYERELLYRTAHGSAADVALLLERTGKPDLQNEAGVPLLSLAAARTDRAAFEIVQRLVALGADVNDGGEAKQYPLHAAIEAGSADMVAFLLKNRADYRLKNANGLSAAELAKDSLNPEVSDVMQAQIEKDQREYALLTSPAGKQKLRYDLTYHACALQYYTYYFESGQDSVSESEQNATFVPHRNGIAKAMARLAQFFEYDKQMLQAQFDVGKKAIHNELESLISNRYRREKGVGQKGDMEKRCTPIAAEFSVKKRLLDNDKIVF